MSLPTLSANVQYLRKSTLFAIDSGNQALDLSQLHFKFKTEQNDEESPSNCSIRIHNLSDQTLSKLKKEFTRIVLNAGYVNGPYGVIFEGTIKQFHIGREEDATTNYVDLLLADGDIGYNWAFSNQTLAKGLSQQQRLDATVGDLKRMGMTGGSTAAVAPLCGGILPRGKVLFGLTRGYIRAQTQQIGASWSIQNNAIQILPLTGYLPGTAVRLSAENGLIGRVEQTADGIKARALLSPLINVGQVVKIDNTSINQTFAQDPNITGNNTQLPYNKYKGVQTLADVTNDGLYRVYVAEFTGDTRGQEWYVDLTCLRIDAITNQVNPNG